MVATLSVTTASRKMNSAFPLVCFRIFPLSVVFPDRSILSLNSSHPVFIEARIVFMFCFLPPLYFMPVESLGIAMSAAPEK